MNKSSRVILISGSVLLLFLVDWYIYTRFSSPPVYLAEPTSYDKRENAAVGFVPDYTTPLSTVNAWLYSIKTKNMTLFTESLDKDSYDRYRWEMSLDKALDFYNKIITENNITTTGNISEGILYKENKRVEAKEIEISPVVSNQRSIKVTKENGLWKVHNY